MEAIFRVDGNDVVTSPYAAGPWDPGMQHGSPPASLVVWAAERIATPVPMRITSGYIVLSLFVSTTIGLIAGIYPAMRASRLDPVIALNKVT